MKHFTLLVFYFSFGCAAAQNTIVAKIDTVNYVDTNGLRQGYWIIYGFNQKNSSYRPDGIVEEGNYIDSKKTGKWTSYWPNGKKKSEMTYANNRPNGNAVTYSENGHKSEEGFWKGVRWIGDYRLYYENDTVRLHYFYDPTAQRQGKQFTYYPNGKLQTVEEYKGGKKNGYRREYDSTGTLIKETYYENDAIILPWIVADTIRREDTPAERESIKNAFDSLKCKCDCTSPGKGHFTGEGVWILFKEGRIEKKGCFKAYRLVCGIQCIYDVKGKLIQIKKYEEGKYVGDAALPKQ